MVVEDQLDLVNVLQIFLAAEGHSVTVAQDGASALRMLGLVPENPGVELPDLILLDVMIPQIDGYAVNLKLFNNERTKNLPVIVLTVRPEMRDLFAHISHNRVFMAKPFSYKELKDHVRRILGPQA